MIYCLFHVYNPNIKTSIFDIQNSKCKISKMDSPEFNMIAPHYSAEWWLLRYSKFKSFQIGIALMFW